MAELTGGRIFGVYDAPIEGGKWGNRLGASIDSYQAGFQGVGEEVADAVGLEGVRDFFRSAREENEAQAEYQRRQAQRQGAIMSYNDVGGVGDALDYVGGLAVDSAPYLVESALGGVAGRALLTGGKTALGLSRAAAGTVGGAAASYTSAVGDILQNQREEPGGTTNLGAAALGGIPYVALNALGVSGAASRAGGLRRAGIDMLDNMGANGGSLARVGGALARTGVAFGKNALEEGIGETGQEMINQGFGRMAVNPDQTLFNPEANERYLESFIGGAALGGTVGGAAGGWRRSEGFRLPADQSLDDPAKPADLLGSKLTDATPGAQGSLFGGLGTEGLASPIPLLPGETDNASQYRALQEQLQGITDPAERRAAELNWLPDQPTNAGQADFLQQYQQLAGSLQQVESGMADAEAAGDANRFYALQELRDDLARQLEPLERRFSAIQAERVQPGQMSLFSSGEAPQPKPAPAQQTPAVAATENVAPSPAQPVNVAASPGSAVKMWDIGRTQYAKRDDGVIFSREATRNGGATPWTVARVDEAVLDSRPDHRYENPVATLPSLDEVDSTGESREAKQYFREEAKRAWQPYAANPELGLPRFEDLAPEAQDAWQAAVQKGAHKRSVAQAVAAMAPVAPSPAPTPTSEQPSVEVPAETGAVTPVAKAVPATRAASQPVEAPGRAVVAPAPQTTQPATVAGIDATKTVAVGRSGRQKLMTVGQVRDAIRGANLVERRRIARAMGWDVSNHPTTGAPIMVELDAPMTFAEIGRREEEETGEPVTREGIRLSMLKFKIDPKVIERATASDWDTNTFSAAEFGIGATGDGDQDTSGMRVESTATKAFGQGLIKDDAAVMTAKQRELHDEATRLLEEAGAVPSTGTAVAKPTAQAVEQVDARVQRNIEAAREAPWADEAREMWNPDNMEATDLPDTLAADWVLEYGRIRMEDGLDAPITREALAKISRLQSEIEDEYRDYLKYTSDKGRNHAGLEGPARGQEDRPQIGGPDQGGNGRLEYAAATEAQATPEPDLGTRVRSKLKAAGQNVAKAGLTDEELAEAIRIYEQLKNTAKATEAKAEQEARGQAVEQAAPTPFTTPTEWIKRQADTSKPLLPGLPQDTVQQMVDQALDTLGVRDKVRIEVHRNPASSGVAGGDGVVATGANLSDGRLLLFSDFLPNRLEVLKTVFHELFHSGLSRTVSQGEYIQLMLKFKSDPIVRQYAQRWKESEDGVSRRGTMPVNNYEALAVEEALAQIGEAIGLGELGNAQRHPLVRSVIKVLSDLADMLGFRKEAQALRRMTYTAAEQFVADVLQRSDFAAPTQLRATRFRQAGTTAEAAPTGGKLGNAAKAATKQSRGSSASGSGGAGLYPAVRHYTVETLTEELKRFVRADALGRAVKVIDSVADIPHWVDTSGVDASTRALTAISNGRATVFLIADRIQKGRAKAVFLHEVGVHLGLERRLPTAVYKKIVGRIQTLRENYLSGADTSVSAMLASAAYDRVVSAHPNTTESADPELFDSELVAYFVEESVIAGIDPTASTKLDAPLRSWFRTLWASFKSALRRLGYKDASSFTAQDAVDMAYGAARLEVAGTFHGTAANFRRFDHRFMGSGEGAQAFGWGTYLAQRFGIATDYWAADINRKKRNGASPEGGVMRVDAAVMEGDLLDWYAPMSEQSALLEKVKAQMPSDLLAAVEAEVKKPLESMTGADLYEAMVFIGGRGSDLVSRNVRNVRQNAGAAEVASRYLDEVLDVPGVRFFDAASRTPAGVLVYRGNVYTPDDLRNLRKQGGDLGAYASTLRSVLRNGLDAEIRDLEAKVKATSDMLFGVDRDSAARFGVPFEADSAKQLAEAEAMKTFDGQQLAWLQANRGDIEVRTADRTKNLVVFNDKNLYRVSTRRGNSRERTLFSKSIPSEAAPTGGKKVVFAKPPYMEQAPSELWETAQGALGVLRDWTFTRGAFTRDLLDAAAKMMPAAQTYRDKMQRARVESMKLERDVAAITDAFAALPAHERGTGGRSVNALIRKMTYDNKWAFAPSWVPNVTPDPELAAWFNGLSADARKVVIGVFQHGHETLKQVQQAALDSIKSEVDPLIADARAKGDMATVKELEKAKVKADGKFRRLMELRGQTPYAPLRRFGNWAVVAKSRMYQDAEAAGDKDQMDKLSRDGKHYHVEFAPNRLAAAARAKKLKAAMGDVSVNHFERSDDKLLYGGESMFKAFSRFRTLAREEMADSEGKVVTALDKTLASMYMTLVAETSARTAEFERKSVAGADQDMMRAFATQGRAMANFIGSLKTSGEIMETLRTLKKQSHQGANQADKSQLYNEIMRRHAMGMNYEPNQLLDKSLAANSYWSLITSPSYFLTNLTQPWVASLPVLAGRFGVGRSTGEMFRAYKEIARIATKLVDNPGAVKDLPKDVQKVVEELLNRGSIDISVGADLGQFTSGGNSLVNAHMERAIRMPRTLAERGEMVNRVATAVAAYRLARGSMPEAAAIDYADKVIYETHGDYSAFNAPRVMRNSVGRFATQFRKFQLIQISLYARLFRDAFAKLPEGASAEDRKAAADARFVARKALAYSLGMTFALGGMTAMPGYTAISFILGSVLGLGDDDEPDDPEATLRRALGGGPMADLLIRGVPNLAGINIGSRIGAAGMLSILPYTDLEASRDGYKDILLGLAGPFVGGTLPKALDGLGLMLNGDYPKGLEMMLPRGLGDALKGVRFGTEGVTKRNGDVVLSGEEVSFLAAAAQAIGLPTTSITDNQMLRNSQFKADDFYKDRTTQLKRQYVEAYRDGDGTKLQEVRQAWMETQEARKRLGYDVQPMSTLLKAPQEQRKREAKPLKTALVE